MKASGTVQGIPILTITASSARTRATGSRSLLAGKRASAHLNTRGISMQSKLRRTARDGMRSSCGRIAKCASAEARGRLSKECGRVIGGRTRRRPEFCRLFGLRRSNGGEANRRHHRRRHVPPRGGLVRHASDHVRRDDVEACVRRAGPDACSAAGIDLAQPRISNRRTCTPTCTCCRWPVHMQLQPLILAPHGMEGRDGRGWGIKGEGTHVWCTLQ